MKNVLQKSADNHDDPGGRLDPTGFYRHVAFHTYAPPVDLAPFIDHFWTIRWNKASEQPYLSEQVMHRPYVDLYISADDSGIQGTFRGKRTYIAAGAGRIIGARFHPGAFHALWDGRIADIQDKNVDIQRVFPEADGDYMEQLLSLDDQAVIDALAKMVRDKNPQPDPNIELISEIITATNNDGSLETVKAVAQRFHRSERWMQQLFQEYVGVGLKWMLQRNKLLEAAKRIRESENPDWAAIAYDVSYSSQQHFIADFKRVLGKTPLQYKKALVKVAEELEGVEVIAFAGAAAFDSWLVDNYQRQDGVWLKMAKKGSGIPSLTDDEAVDVGLCWGWISGQRRSHDQPYYLQKYVPRRPRSVWSQVNVEKVAALIAAGRMQAPGLAEVAAAKADGRWDAAYVSQRNATPPPDLVKALARNEVARDFFASLNKTDQYAVILRLVKERNAAGRAARLKKMVAAMAADKKVR